MQYPCSLSNSTQQSSFHFFIYNFSITSISPLLSFCVACNTPAYFPTQLPFLIYNFSNFICHLLRYPGILSNSTSFPCLLIISSQLLPTDSLLNSIRVSLVI